MSAVDYHGILTELKAILEEDPAFDLSGAGKAIVLTLSRRRPTSRQPLAAGKRTRWEVSFSVWAMGFDMSFEAAASKRDDLVGALELVLMNNRTVSGKLGSGWLEGGEFISVRD